MRGGGGVAGLGCGVGARPLPLRLQRTPQPSTRPPHRSHVARHILADGFWQIARVGQHLPAPLQTVHDAVHCLQGIAQTLPAAREPLPDAGQSFTGIRQGLPDVRE